MTKARVRGGTPTSHQDNLCLSCVHACIRRNDKSDTTILCDKFNKQVVSNTTECNMYHEKQQTSLREMIDVAWIINPSNIKNKVGFRSFNDLEAAEQIDFYEKVAGFEHD